MLTSVEPTITKIIGAKLKSTIKPSLIFIGILCILVLCVCQADAKVSDTPVLAVSIASFIDSGKRVLVVSDMPLYRFIEGRTVLHFDVVLRNISDRPQTIFPEDCIAGNDALTLEIVAINGKTLTHPIKVERRPGGWEAHMTRGVTLEPGDVSVREVCLYPYAPGDRKSYVPGDKKDKPITLQDARDYLDFPPVPQGPPFTIRMRAVFEVPASLETKTFKAWSGRVVSEIQDYVFLGVYPN